MAGHSKWANIKRRKAVVDARRGKLFTRCSREIIVAARLGGGDPEGNARLRMAIDNARAVSMPVDNIRRAIQRGTGEIEGVVYEDATYEGYGPLGIAIIVVCTTDHRNRTTQELRATFSKYGGNLGESNSVAWNFQRRGQIRIETDKPEEVLLDVALNVGADDVLLIEDGAMFVCSVESLGTTANNLAASGLIVREQHVVYEPQTLVDCSVDQSQRTMFRKMLDVLDDNDDIQNVFHNADLPDEDT